MWIWWRGQTGRWRRRHHDTAGRGDHQMMHTLLTRQLTQATRANFPWRFLSKGGAVVSTK